MKTRACVSLLFAAISAGLVQLNAAEYAVIGRYFIGGTGGHDYLRVDAAARRIYVAHEKKFEVLDADTGKKVGEIGPTLRAHGTAISPETGHGFATSGIDDRITMFDTKTLQVIKRIKSTGSNPDGIEYDPKTQRVYAANHGSGEITVLDPATGEIVGTVKFGSGKLEGLAFDGRGQGFVNAEDKSSVFVFDLKTLTPKAKWSAAPSEGGTGLACDAANHRLYMACADKLVVLDSDNGSIIARVPIGEDPDGLAFDAETGLIYVSSSDSTLTVVHVDSADKFSVVASVPTQPGARTVALDEKTHHVVLCAPKYGPKPAPVAGGPKPRPPVLPDTFEVLVVGQK